MRFLFVFCGDFKYYVVGFKLGVVVYILGFFRIVYFRVFSYVNVYVFFSMDFLVNLVEYIFSICLWIELKMINKEMKKY